MKKLRVCSFCGDVRLHGVAILEQWMCSECEEKLLNTDVNDPAYQDNKDKMKAIWKTHYLLSRRKTPLQK